MLRRRKKKSVLARMAELVWPPMGWRRTWHYYRHRIKRLPGSPYSIACGFACGAAVSFTPFVGFHFILAALVAWALRGNILASAIGTAVGNPWTFPFIWAGTYSLGGRLLGYEPGRELPEQLSMEHIFEEPVTVFLPMLVGGAPVAVAVWLVFFLPLHRIIANYQHHRQQKRLHRRAALAADAAGAAPFKPGRVAAGNGTGPAAVDIDRDLIDIPDPDDLPPPAPGGAARKARS